ncbi:MAG TPA: DUF6600 domain-containing protein, partial [Pedobacter sp.]
MKNMIKLPVIILGLLLLITGLTQKAMAQEEDISLDTFYQELAPYGTWAQDPDYGYVWRPNVDMSTFRPYYTDGHWAMTEYGNTWVSDYEWGWAPFHYGRWILNRFNEWLWIPDTIWGPAWVSWRSGDGYYGWAPLGPGIDIDENIDEGGYNIPNAWWVFIPQISIYSSSYPRYYSSRNAGLFNRTAYINYNYGRNRHNFFTGPRADDIRRVTHRNVTVYNVNRANRPGRTSISNNNTINIYNPGSGRRGTTGGRSGQNNGNNNSGRGNNPTAGQPAGNTPVNGQPGRNNPANGQNGQSGGRGNSGRGNNPTAGQPAGNTPANGQPGRNNPANGQNGQFGGRGNSGRGNNPTPGQPAGNNPVNGQPAQPATGSDPSNGQHGQFGGRGNSGRGNNPTPGQPAGNTPVSGQPAQPATGSNPANGQNGQPG